MERLFQFAFFVPARDAQHSMFWHQLRDGESFMFLREACLQAGVTARFAGLIRSVPQATAGTLGPDDALLATTRFPLDDRDEDLKKVRRGRNEIEVRLGIPRSYADRHNAQGAARCLFARLERRQAMLQPALAGLLPEWDARYQNVTFVNSRGARITHLDGRALPDSGRSRSLGYFIHIPHAWRDGPGLIWSFGMTGETGLLWNKLVMENHSDWLRRPTFAIGAFDLPPLLNDPDEFGPPTLDDFTAESLDFKLVVHKTLSQADLSAIFGRWGRGQP